MSSQLTFNSLVNSIQQIYNHFTNQAARSINITLTLKNWFIGYYIVTYEQNGADRAKYGQHLLDNIAQRLKRAGLNRVDARELRRYRQFFLTYPQIREAVSPESNRFLEAVQKFLPIRQSPSPEFKLNGKTILEKLSFSHLTELMKIPDDFKRTFYEIECIRGHWSVRELKRQIASLYYARSGVSKDKTTSIRLFSVTPKRPLEVNLPNPVFAFDANGFIFSAPAI